MWRASTGLTGRCGAPWWIHDGDGKRPLYAANGRDIRRFQTREAAERMADKLNRRDYESAEMLSARRHLSAALLMIGRATNHTDRDDPRIAAATDLAAVWHALGGPTMNTPRS